MPATIMKGDSLVIVGTQTVSVIATLKRSLQKGKDFRNGGFQILSLSFSDLNEIT